MIAGKIIPAIATTTATVTGLVMTEMIKVVLRKPLEAYRDSSNNLGINAYYFSEPVEPVKEKDEYDVVMMEDVKCRPTGFTKWDQTVVEISPSATLEDFLAAFKGATDGLKCTQIYHKCNGEEGSPVSGRFIYESAAWKASLKELYASKMNVPLLSWMKERYGEYLRLKKMKRGIPSKYPAWFSSLDQMIAPKGAPQ